MHLGSELLTIKIHPRQLPRTQRDNEDSLHNAFYLAQWNLILIHEIFLPRKPPSASKYEMLYQDLEPNRNQKSRCRCWRYLLLVLFTCSGKGADEYAREEGLPLSNSCTLTDPRARHVISEQESLRLRDTGATAVTGTKGLILLARK